MALKYYNIGAPYEIMGRITEGTTVIAYIVKNRESDDVINISKEDTEQLALNKQIYNCHAQVYGNLVNLKGINCKLSKLPKYDKDGNELEVKYRKKRKQADLILTARIVQGRTVVGYRVSKIDNLDDYVHLTRDKVMELAKDGKIINAKVQKSNGKVLLRSNNGYNISKLKDLEVVKWKVLTYT